MVPVAHLPAGQARPVTAKSVYSTPKTPWGDPDLQGLWTSDDMRGVPRERPEEFGARQFLTDEEFLKRIEQDEQTQRQQLRGPYGARNDLRTRTFRATSLVVDPSDGRIPALTIEAAARVTVRNRGSFGAGPFDGPEDFSLFDRCITRGVVGSILPVIYGNGNRIVQTPGAVAISYEMVHDTRIVPVDSRPHVGPDLHLYLGDPRGHWEGETLVIETTNFTDRTSISENGNGLRHSGALRLIERITRIAADIIDYRVTVEDPKTYARPWTLVLSLTSPRGYELLPYDCHEGNYGLPNILKGERAEDRALEADARRGVYRERRRPLTNPDAPAAEGSER
ncbi:MAG: hypothetical protein ABJA98_31730 [Acidobacteriota bacterium]